MVQKVGQWRRKSALMAVGDRSREAVVLNNRLVNKERGDENRVRWVCDSHGGRIVSFGNRYVGAGEILIAWFSYRSLRGCGTRSIGSPFRHRNGIHSRRFVGGGRCVPVS